MISAEFRRNDEQSPWEISISVIDTEFYYDHGLYLTIEEAKELKRQLDELL